jgi:type IV secretion system protein VirB10
MRRRFPAILLLLAPSLAISLHAMDPDRDFSGQWVLDTAASDIRSLGQVESSLTVSESDASMLCSAGPVGWSYALDGSQTRTRVGDENWNSVTKWEGAALLVSTLVAGPRNYTVMDRWEISRDRGTLTIARQIVLPSGQVEGRLLFRREGAVASPPPTAPATAGRPPDAAADVPPPALARRAGTGVPPDITVPAGTHVLLSLVNEVSTKHAKEGDRVYLRTAAPVAAGGRVVIPRSSDVAGTITRTKPAGRVSGKGELYIRFDSLILPNGVSRDFHARPPGDEGKVEGNGKSADGRTVMEGAGMGATVGAITRGLPGAAVGGAAGALAGVLLSRNQDVVLRPGTHIEMVLDRDLVFHPEELWPRRPAAAGE